jgi:hypothetical protein
MDMSSSATITKQVVGTSKETPTTSSCREINATIIKGDNSVDEEHAEEEGNEEEEFVFEINEDMLEFFAESAKHKLELSELNFVYYLYL